MTRVRRVLTCMGLCAALAAVPLTAQAIEADLGALESLASRSDTSPIPLGLLVGGTVISYSARYPAVTDTRIALPGFIYLGERLFFMGDRARYYFWRDGPMAAFAYGRLRMGNLDPADAASLQGLHKRKWEFEAGVGGNLVTPYGLFTVRASSDVTGRSKGQDVSVSVDFPLLFDRVLVMPTLALSWRSSKLSNYYFGGVSAEEATPTRPAWDTGATLAPVAALAVSWRINPYWVAALVAAYEHYDRAVANSPLVGHSGEATLVLALGSRW